MPSAAPVAHRPSRRSFMAAAAVAPFALLAACGDDGADSTGVIRLGADDLAPSVDSIQSDGAEGSSVDLDFTDFDGSARNFTTYTGTPLVINFFASWCAPCIAEMPDFEAAFQELDGSVAFVGISIDARLDDARALVGQTGVTYDLGWDPQTIVFNEFGGLGMPTTVLVKPDGTINEVWSGALTRANLIAKIEELT